MDNQPTAQPQPLQYIDVTYYPGVSMYGAGPARLEWTPDNRLKLTAATGTQESPVYTEIFNLSLGEIQKVKSTLDELRIITQGKKYRMSVAQYAVPAIASGGVAGTAVAYGMYKKTGTDRWLQRFRDNGVRVSRFGFGALLGVTLGVVILLGAVIFLLFLLTRHSYQ